MGELRQGGYVSKNLISRGMPNATRMKISTPEISVPMIEIAKWVSV